MGPSDCSTSLKYIAEVDGTLLWNGSSYVLTGGMQSVPVGPGIAIPAGDRLCGVSESGNNVITVSGYSVTSSTVTAPHSAGQAIPKLRHP